MHKAILTLGCALGVAMLTAPVAPPAQAQQEFTLTVAAGQPLRAMIPLQMVEDFFIPEVNKRMSAAGLDGKYKINWRTAWAGSLLKPTMVLEGVRDGIADIGYEPTIFHPDKLPLEQISFMTPFATSSPELVGKAIEQLHATIPQYKEQYDKFSVVRLGGASFDSYELFTTAPVKAFEDVRGKRIATAGAALQWLRGTPATPVQSNMTLYYNSARTGVIDGFIIFPSAIPGMKYPEAAPHVTKVGFGAQYATALIINKSVYDKLPAEVQKIMHEAAEVWGAEADRRQLEAGNKGLASVPTFSGGQNHELSRAEQEKWANAMPNIAKEWAEQLDKQGLPGTKALAAYMDELRKGGANPVRNWDKE